MQPEQFEAGIARLPRWLLALAVVGTIAAAVFRGFNAAGGFLFGSLAAYVNLRLVERAVNRITASAQSGKKRRTWLFIQFAALVFEAFVIMNFSGFSMAAAFFGFLVCPAAVVLEIVYELVKYDHS
jgi:hypothetical protein